MTEIIKSNSFITFNEYINNKNVINNENSGWGFYADIESQNVIRTYYKPSKINCIKKNKINNYEINNYYIDNIKKSIKLDDYDCDSAYEEDIENDKSIYTIVGIFTICLFIIFAPL